jgi:choline-glycine betaine transporter
MKVVLLSIFVGLFLFILFLMILSLCKIAKKSDEIIEHQYELFNLKEIEKEARKNARKKRRVN